MPTAQWRCGAGGTAGVVAEAGQVGAAGSAASWTQLILPSAPALPRSNLTRVRLYGVQSHLQIAAWTHPKRKINIW